MTRPVAEALTPEQQQLNESLFELFSGFENPVGEEQIDQIKALIDQGADINSEVRVRAGIENLLSIAAKKGLLNVVDFLITNKVNVAKYGMKALQSALTSGKEEAQEIGQMLVDEGVDINADYEHGQTLLTIFAEYDKVEAIELALNLGAYIESKNIEKKTALAVACYNGSFKAMNLLLERGAKVDVDVKVKVETAPDDYSDVSDSEAEVLPDVVTTPLISVISSREILVASRLEVIRHILARDVEVDAQDTEGNIALLKAVEMGDKEVVSELLLFNPDLQVTDKEGYSALMIAIENGHLEIAELLLDNGAGVNIVASDGWTPLMLAAKNNNVSVVESLLKKGASVDFTGPDGWTSLMFAAYNGHQSIVELLVDNGADVDAVNADGWTPLMIAARYGHQSVMEFLMENGAIVDLIDPNGWTSLMTAVEFGSQSVVEFLLEKGANVNSVTQEGWTPLWIAVRYGHQFIVEFLLANGADVNAVDVVDGWTPLTIAARYGHQFVESLLVRGAKVNVANMQGDTALKIAADKYEEGGENIEKFLKVVNSIITQSFLRLRSAEERAEFEELIRQGGVIDDPVVRNCLTNKLVLESVILLAMCDDRFKELVEEYYKSNAEEISEDDLDIFGVGYGKAIELLERLPMMRDYHTKYLVEMQGVDEDQLVDLNHNYLCDLFTNPQELQRALDADKVIKNLIRSWLNEPDIVNVFDIIIKAEPVIDGDGIHFSSTDEEVVQFINDLEILNESERFRLKTMILEQDNSNQKGEELDTDIESLKAKSFIVVLDQLFKNIDEKRKSSSITEAVPASSLGATGVAKAQESTKDRGGGLS